MSDAPDLVTPDEPGNAARRLALFDHGFRPFFVLAALHAVSMIPLWIVARSGLVSVGGYFHPTAWHAHEMVFGFASAVVAGFLLTAASNWTKRVTATGPWLAALTLAWLLGRLAPMLAGRVPDLLVFAMSVLFLPCLALVIGRVVFGAKSRRNYGLVALIGLLSSAQLVTHLGVLTDDLRLETTGARIGVDLIVVVILVIGGRIIPAFTRNATKAEGIRSHRSLDIASFALALALPIADGLRIDNRVVAALAVAAAVVTAARAIHWGLGPALRDPMLWVLHLGYFFVPLGFGARAVGALTPSVSGSTAAHLLTVGAIGTLTLGMMTRVSLGHTGRPIVAPRVLTFAFVSVILAALVRVGGPLIGGPAAAWSLHASATLWALAFGIFVVRIGPSLFLPRPDGRPG